MKQPRGVLLILSLVMTSVVLTASLILGTIIIREVRLSAVSDKGITAYYASETSGEEAMYRLLKLGEDPLSLTGAGSFANGASWEREAQEESSQFIFDYIGEDNRIEVNVFNKNAAVGEAGVESAAISWSSGQTMEVEVYEWNGSAITQLPTSSFLCSGAPCASAIVNDLTADKAYRLIIIARGAAITDAVIDMYSANGAGGSPVLVTSPRTVFATGEYGGAQQAVQLSLPVAPPWAGGSVPPPAAVCGNGIVETGENCDDNNTVSGDGCSAACLLEIPPADCGNSIVESGETCDDGNATEAGECNASCTGLTYCGDGTVQSPNGDTMSAETCDDGNNADGDGCSANCQTEAAAVLTSIVITPNPAATTGFVTGSSTLAGVQFTAQGKDQFGNNMTISPAPTWTRTSGSGVINASGYYTPSNTETSFSVMATSGSVSGSASGTVSCPPCTTLNLAGQSTQLDGPWTGSYVAYSAYRSYPRCGGSYYSASFSLVTPFATSCANTYPANNCATYYEQGATSPNWFGGSTYGWGIVEIGRYKKYDYPQYPTVTITQGAEQFCK